MTLRDRIERIFKGWELDGALRHRDGYIEPAALARDLAAALEQDGRFVDLPPWLGPMQCTQCHSWIADPQPDVPAIREGRE